jgi:uncharacterized membrane protein YgcG
MKRIVNALILALILAAIGTGTAWAALKEIPENKAQEKLQHATTGALPGDAKALEAALAAKSPVAYKILVIDSTEGEDKTAYLDRVAEKWGLPKADQLYLIIYTGSNYDIRFYMGANFRKNGVTVDEMLKLVRAQYLANSQKGLVADGLAKLIEAVNQRMATGSGM